MTILDEKKTLRYALAFLISEKENVDFIIGKKKYQHIQTIYDMRQDNFGTNTVCIIYNYSSMKYEALNMNDKIGDKIITIL